MVMPILPLLPVVAILGAVTLLGEVPDPRVLICGAIMILGVGAVITAPSYLIDWWRKITD